LKPQPSWAQDHSAMVDIALQHDAACAIWNDALDRALFEAFPDATRRHDAVLGVIEALPIDGTGLAAKAAWLVGQLALLLHIEHPGEDFSWCFLARYGVLLQALQLLARTMLRQHVEVEASTETRH
jgi:hypothetical protein